MSSAFCRGCGQSIHLAAVACPHCGAPQATVRSLSKAQGHPTLAVISCVIAGVTLLMVMADDIADRDSAIGLIMFALAGGIFGSVSIALKKPGHIMAVVGTVLSAIFLLIGIGSLNP